MNVSAGSSKANVKHINLFQKINKFAQELLLLLLLLLFCDLQLSNMLVSYE
jgi:hypothetical protein